MGYVAQSHQPSFKRMMAFIDGENMVLRFQDMEKAGFLKRDGLFHVPDTCVWSTEAIQLEGQTEIYRAVYYTYFIGDDGGVEDFNSKIKQLNFPKGTSALPNNLKPHVRKKNKGTRGKGVDIKLTVDVLSSVYNNTLDIVYLISGDGDFLPIIKEAQRHGKLVYLAAFSSGLNSKLLNYVDKYYCLDDVFFQTKK
jgi:uncharacterized LabA/DUF88 family protein